MNTLSQKDPRWANLKIGNTNYTMSGYGCFITACCIVSGIDPPEALQRLRFDGAMLIWESITNIGLQPLFKGDWDNTKALEYIQANGQCIARVDFDGSDRTDDTHFVVLIGNKQLIDPIDGKIKPTSTYSKYTGIRACRKITMLPDEIAVKKTDFERLVSKSSALDDILARYQVADAQGIYNMVSGKDSRITDLTKQLGTAQAEVTNKLEIIKQKDETIANLNLDNQTLIERLEVAAENCIQLGKDKGNLAIEVEQLKIQVETLKQQVAEGKITLTVADLFRLIWNQKITISKG